MTTNHRNARALQQQRRPLGNHGGLMLYPDEALRKIGITEPVHPNQANRVGDTFGTRTYSGESE